MNLAVGSYFEMHTTLIGWMMYDLVWEALSVTGIVFLPLGWILFRNWRDASSNANNTPATGLSLRRNLWDIMIAALVILLAATPAIIVKPGQISYTPTPSIVEPDPVKATADNDPSTYAKQFGAVDVSGGVRMPIWWALVSQVSSGITSAVLFNLPSSGDLAAARVQMQAARITDPDVSQELSHFIDACYIPAISKLKRMVREQGYTPALKARITKYGPHDIEWIGSHVFMETEGLYKPCGDVDTCHDSLQANLPVKGWSYMESRDHYGELDQSLDTPGRPWCDEWWNGAGGDGLRDKLLAQAEQNGADDLWRNLQSFLAEHGLGDADKIKDATIKNLLDNSRPGKVPVEYQYANHSGANAGFFDNVVDKATTIAGTLGAAFKAAETGITMKVVRQALPYIKAIILMGIIIVLPFMLIMGAYSLDMVFTASVIFFTVYFLSALWGIAQVIDDYATLGMFPDAAGLIAYMLYDTAATAATAGQVDLGGFSAATQAMILSMLSVMTYIGLPAIWMFMMTWVGIKAGHSVDKIMTSTTSPAQSTGSAGASAGGKIAKGGLSRRT